MAPLQPSKLQNRQTLSDYDSGSEKIEASPNNSKVGKKISEYEKLRLKRIEENRERMDALGLKTMANSLVGSAPNQAKRKGDKKGKGKIVDDDDEEYSPSDEEEDLGFSSEEDEPDNDDDDDDFSLLKVKKKAKNSIRTSKKQVSFQKCEREEDYVDDDDALMQAIALSLQDSARSMDVHNLSSSSSAKVDSMQNERERNSQTQEDTGKRKRKKPTSSRVQMNDDELTMHFFQFDELGKGSLTLRDLWRVAAAHDFTWSDKEMADMIHYFDSDGDGKISLDDFRKIAVRCNMIQETEGTIAG